MKCCGDRPILAVSALGVLIPLTIAATGCMTRIRRAGKLPAEGAVAPGLLTGIGWSDHWSFARIGVPALMVTDTALFRYAHHHEETDTPEMLDFDRLARAVVGLADVVRDLSRAKGAR